MKRNMKTALLANLLAIAIVLSIVESMIPVIPVPGAKLGFANIVTLIVIYTFSAKEGVFITVLRVILVSLLMAKFLSPVFYMSLSGGLVASIAMGLLKKTDFFGVIGVSVIGSIFHCIGQIVAGVFVIGDAVVLYYLPIMLLLSVPTGILVGIITKKFLDITKIWFGEK
ncbi:MAG: Gx transporter family protein, partial [Acholeplasmataceae bacterium]|nr:Gx transporter family protein [Acholeplasmataceae bacterium]